MNAAKHKQPSLTIRWFIRRDMEDVLHIDRCSFSNFWREEDYLKHLRQRNCIGMIAELPDHTIVGSMVYELHKSRLTLLRICVAYEHRRKGVGTAMVTRLKDKLSQQRRRFIRVNVNEYDLASQLFFSRRGFLGSPDGDEIKFEYDAM